MITILSALAPSAVHIGAVSARPMTDAGRPAAFAKAQRAFIRNEGVR
jgi:hypothetical protein